MVTIQAAPTNVEGGHHAASEVSAAVQECMLLVGGVDKPCQ
jgi:hypothetical protein